MTGEQPPWREPARDDLPWWADDPLVDRRAHRLAMRIDWCASALAGRDLVTASCSCRKWATPGPQDDQDALGSYENHMAAVQAAAHAEQERRHAESRRAHR